MRSVAAIAQPSSTAPTVSTRLAHHRIGQVRVLESGIGARVSEQPGDGEHALALPQRERGVGVSQIMEAQVGQLPFGAHPATKGALATWD